jgi:TP53 regulating kinase-like protein
VLGIEWVEGTSVRKVLGGGAEGEDEAEEGEEVMEADNETEVDELKDVYGLTQGKLVLVNAHPIYFIREL